MKKAPQQPRIIVGKNYDNRGGGTFHILGMAGDDAVVRNVKSGWQCIAHGIQIYEDGTIEWNYSTGGRFA